MSFLTSLLGGSQEPEQTADIARQLGQYVQSPVGQNLANQLSNAYYQSNSMLGMQAAYYSIRTRPSYGRSISRSRNRYCTRSGSY